MYGLLFLVLAWLAVGLAVAAWFGRKTAVRLWREPVLKHPVLIIESDDWGAGPVEQASQLERIAAVLASHADIHGQKPVMTLGVVLAVPDGARIAANGMTRYFQKSLDQAEIASVVLAMKAGAESGVFALQLHGGEHYWPVSLLAASKRDPSVAAWLSSPGWLATEALPSRLQSRWIDAAELPSKPLPGGEVTTAAREEVACFQRIFGRPAVVAVPPTFIWNDVVEHSWAEAGVKVVVTPGRRYEARDSNGEPIGGGKAILNGDQGLAGIIYVVRDDYFEPLRGHNAMKGLEAVARKAALGRPALLETHRVNFLSDVENAEMTLRELDRLLTIVLEAFPQVRFMSTEVLATRVRRRDGQLVEQRLSSRLHVWLRRLWAISHLRKLAWLTGMVIPGCLLYLSTRPKAGGGR